MSEAERYASGYGSATLQSLRNRIDDYSEILYQDTFKATDLDGDRQESKSVISFLKANSAIESVDKLRDEQSNKLINVWGWANHQDELQEHFENRDTLPCGCRSHIPPERDGDTFYCKFCGDGHDRETIKEAL